MRSVLKVIVLLLVGFAVGVLAVRNPGQEPSSAVAEVQDGGSSAERSVAAVDDHGAAGGACVKCQLPDFTVLAEDLSHAVVNISTSSKGDRGGDRGDQGDGNGGGGGGGSPRFHGGPRGQMPGFPPGGGQGQDPREFWEPFERFFGPMPRRRAPERSLGSGFIFDPAGYILTNNHVVENANEIKVKLNSGEEMTAELVGRDPKTDLAVLKIDAKENLPTIPFGDSEKVKVGEWVMAIGNPFGLEFSVTAGIVSAKGRFIGQGNYDDFLQTDTPINPGNSGGPLLDLNGRVVGINTSIFSRSGGNIGIGFAIPINLAKDLIPQMRDKGKVTRGWIGVMIQKVTPDIADSLGLKASRGALVADVVKGGPAEEAGIKVGDVIVSFDGRDVRESTELPTLVAREKIGQEVPVVVMRDGTEETVSIKIAEMKDDEDQVATGESEAFGLAVQNLTPEIAESLGIGIDVQGVLVSGVEPGSPADEAGLRRGDVIVEVNRKPVKDVDGYKKEMKATGEGKSVLMLVRRGENTLFLALKPPTG
ncbi:MAG: DegQ family serine endoprotease [Deltaproteobacteria bacterium]|nr:DegQ family serine endoprotease [Deltaproteobacteria bacterium]